jgi:hypothetical protein
MKNKNMFIYLGLVMSALYVILNLVEFPLMQFIFENRVGPLGEGSDITNTQLVLFIVRTLGGCLIFISLLITLIRKKK